MKQNTHTKIYKHDMQEKSNNNNKHKQQPT